MTVKMIAVDMDGTFLRDDKTYDKLRFSKLLKELDQAGITFVVASGNQYRQLITKFPDHYEDLTFVAENGANIVSNGESLVEIFQSHADVEELIHFIQAKYPETVICLTGRDSAYVLETVSQEQQDFLKPYMPKMDLVESLLPLPEDEYFKVVLLMDEDKTSEILEAVNRHFDQGNLIGTSSGFGCIDVITKGAHKAWGLGELLTRQGLSGDNLMAFGDGYNDLEMLSLAKYSYAMANAHDDVKAVANYQAKSNQEDGVLQAIEDYLKGLTEVNN
ncbi:Cof-type HAD-IIB family hydrolase [Streptococcus loxodontisalivarius]|uniref:Cof subfamily protein (Haloacid dehalogenase superfamily) n=1 Tax=Streptococcus loxodontisalivarius TaxID=1349415 RepID=A0ABS2PSE2_9STRE|nr:Cof-type HAD-IIB family hydrolase [Streptococcus loxodontisalivarius]MBM7642954.1 Cof subfamily protein (haloacid dehalogenase superfamily) [Streptococcus loxodontisalivarius]